MLDAIVVPFIDKEVDLLKSWLRYMPRSGVSAGRLYLSNDGSWLPHVAPMLRDVFSRSELAAEHWTLHFIDCAMPASESFYLRGNDSVVDLARFPYGTKSGPNQQFFRTMRALRQLGVAAPCLLLEVDAFPTRPQWLFELDAVIGSADFLIAGSAYAGQSRLAPQISRHFNGNSVYGLGHRQFDDFLSAWERLLLHCLKFMPALAYDIVLEWFRNRSAADLKAAAKAEFAELMRIYAETAHDLTGCIVNYGGAHESRAGYTLDVEHFVETWPDAVVVHGKCFIESIYRLRGFYYGKVAPPFRNPTNLAMAALQRGDVDQALLSGHLGSEVCETLINSPSQLGAAQRHLIGAQFGVEF